MTELLTAAQMRAIEQAAIASGEVTGLELMERAGRGVVESIFEEWPELAKTSHRAVVLCGPGNNGGDGFVVARLLKDWGWEVEVFLYGDPEKMPPDARVNYERWLGMGEVRSLGSFGARETPLPSGADLFVDALLGTGANRPVGPILGEDFHPFQVARKTIAIDIPSGIDADSGRAIASSPGAFMGDVDLTVTFEYAKLGHYLGSTWRNGKLVVKPLMISSFAHWEALSPELSPVELNEAEYSAPNKGHSDPGGHKFTHGHALILSGPSCHTGAARLAARGALRIGAGLVTVGAEPQAIPEHAAQLSAIMLRPVPDAAVLIEALGDPRINALCLGPGLGLDDRAQGLVAAALGVSEGAPHPHPLPTKGRGGAGRRGGAGGEALPPPLLGRGEGWGARPVVLDADALTILSQHPDLFAALHEGCVLTPHAGEFARLFPDIAEKLNQPATKGPAYSKVDATREAAERAGCVILYKGPDTVIADQSGRCAINSAHYDRAAPWLATAGSGDVLAGFITGLLARGFAPMQAAETAAWLHVECALKFGPGLIAEDLPEQLPAVFRAMGL